MPETVEIQLIRNLFDLRIKWQSYEAMLFFNRNSKAPTSNLFNPLTSEETDSKDKNLQIWIVDKGVYR